MDIKDIITIVSVVLAFISLAFGIYNYRKSHYLNIVTSSRIKYLENLRNVIAEYSGLALSSIKDTNKHQSYERIVRLNYLIKLHLDRNHPFDSKIIEKVNSILQIYHSGNNHKIETEINKLIELVQDILYLEWNGIKDEATKGILSKKKKIKLNNKYLKIRNEYEPEN